MPIKTLISKADIEKVSEGIQFAKAHYFAGRTLISTANPLLCSNPGEIIKKHTTLSVEALKEYMAVCTFVHTTDGWSYLSNAINALLNGEPSITIHLAYYAELRAAIAFLSSEGILIINNEQACIDHKNNMYVASKQVKQIKPSGTHSATWNIMDEWLSDNVKGTPILQYFTYQGKTFEELIPFIPHSATTAAGQVIFVKKWLRTWCFDIHKYEEDKNGRNSSSYNANIYRQFSPHDLKDCLIVLNEFWSSLEPSIDCFSKLDQYLFSLYLKEVYNAATSNRISLSKKDFIDDFYKNSGITEDIVLSKMFVNDEENLLIKYAKDAQIDPKTGEVLPLTIVSRAILLLRFCCGACSFLFKKNMIIKNDLDFYINKVGQNYGLWELVSPIDLKELWIDVNDLLIDFENYLRTSSPSNIFALKHSFLEYSDVYTQFSRAGLWGLGL